MDIQEEIIELENADGVVVKFAFVATVEHEGCYYAALEAIESAEGIDLGDVVIFKLFPEGEEMELVTDEDLLDVLFDKVDEALEEEEE